MINDATLRAAFHTDLCTSEKGAAEFVDAIMGTDEKAKTEAMAKVNEYYGMINKALANEVLEAEVYERAGMDPDAGWKGIRTAPQFIKSASTGITPVVQNVQGIDFIINEFAFDTNYTQFYNTQSAEGGDEIDILDFVNQITHKEYNFGEPIESVPFGKKGSIRMGQKRFGGGSFMFRQMMKNQLRYTVNGIIRGHAAAEMVLRADRAYTGFAALSPSTETFDTNIITTVNKGYLNQITTLSGAGYQVTESTPAFLLCNIAHKAAVNAAFRTIMGDNGTNTLLEFPVQPIFTANANFPVQKAAKNFGLLIFPARKSVWGNFTSARVEQTMMPRNDSQELTYQYYFNHREEVLQTRIINLQA